MAWSSWLHHLILFSFRFLHSREWKAKISLDRFRNSLWRLFRLSLSTLGCSTHRFRPTKYPKMQRKTKTSNRNSILRRRCLSLVQLEFTFSFTSQSLCQSFRFVIVSVIAKRGPAHCAAIICGSSSVHTVESDWRFFERCFTFGFLNASAEFDASTRSFSSMRCA